MKKITLEAACKKQGIDMTLPAFPGFSEKAQKQMIAHYKLAILTQAYNGDWEADYTNEDQLKYYPWFLTDTDEGKLAGSGFRFVDCVRTYTLAYVGPRLCLQSADLVRQMAKDHLALYKEYFLGL